MEFKGRNAAHFRKYYDQGWRAARILFVSSFLFVNPTCSFHISLGRLAFCTSPGHMVGKHVCGQRLTVYIAMIYANMLATSRKMEISQY